MKRLLSGLAILVLAGCITGKDDGGTINAEALARDWRLVTLNGADFAARATMDLREAGRASGQAPCNRWFGTIEGALPAFILQGVAATKMACPDMAAEADFLAALGRAELVALEQGRLVLTGADGLRMEFAPAK